MKNQPQYNQPDFIIRAYKSHLSYNRVLILFFLLSFFSTASFKIYFKLLFLHLQIQVKKRIFFRLYNKIKQRNLFFFLLT